MKKMLRKVLRAVADVDPDYFDMYADPQEACFARLYLERIRCHAAAAGIAPPASIVEAGCQAGRLVVPLAREGYAVTGIDTSGFALRRARAHAKRAGVQAAFVRGDLGAVLARDPSRRYDMAVCAEVLYLTPRYRELLAMLAGAVRPGGLVFVSHRSRDYYLLEALRADDPAAAAGVLGRGEGAFRDSKYYNWQTEAQLRSLYASVGLTWNALYPIDRIAWLTGLTPGALDAAGRERWLQAELELSESPAMCTRYVLVVASRPARQTA